MVPAGLGTQVVGSILRPASFCGAVGFKPSVGAINRSGSHDHFSQSCQGAIGATLADTWAVLRAIADRAGGDPGFVGLTGDVDFAKRTKPDAARRARNRRLEGHQRRRAQGVCRGQGAARQGRHRAEGPPRRSRHRGGREGDCRRAAADARHQRLGGPLAAQHLRRSRRRRSSAEGAREPAEDRRGDDAGAIRRTADAARGGARGLRQGREQVRRVRHARRLRRGAGGPRARPATRR